MNQYKVVLFDLDGTLTDPKVGITTSIQYALDKLGIHEPDLDSLEHFIGPPLHQSLADAYGFDEETTKLAVSYYRERFAVTGLYENKLYPDIPELLETLKKQEKILVVATSKATIFAEKILKHFSIAPYFSLIVGSNLDGTRSAKSEIIGYALDQFKPFDKNDFVMIGDRKYDIIGANSNGIDSIGVLYGYGSREELAKANPTDLVSDVKALGKRLLGAY